MSSKHSRPRRGQSLAHFTERYFIFQRFNEETNKAEDCQDFRDKFPYLRLGPDGHGCYDPEGGILLADKALRAIQAWEY